jgi:hypothetical protein
MEVFMRMPVLGLFVTLGFCVASAPAWAQAPYSIHVGGWSQNITREACAHQAIAAMAKEKFIHAEIDAEGNAWGYSDKTVVVVISFRQPDGINVINFAASRDNDDAGRLRQLVRSYIQEATYDAKAPQHIGGEDDVRGASVPYLHWQVKNRNVIGVLRFFDSAVCILLEKKGLGSNICGKTLVMGGKPDQAVAAFLVPGPNAISVNVGVLAVNPSDETSRKVSRAFCKEIVKLLYE